MAGHISSLQLFDSMFKYWVIVLVGFAVLPSCTGYLRAPNVGPVVNSPVGKGDAGMTVTSAMVVSQKDVKEFARPIYGGVNIYKTTSDHTFIVGEGSLSFSDYKGNDQTNPFSPEVNYTRKFFGWNITPGVGLFKASGKLCFTAGLGIPIVYNAFIEEINVLYSPGSHDKTTIESNSTNINFQPQLSIVYRGGSEKFRFEPFVGTSILTNLRSWYNNSYGRDSDTVAYSSYGAGSGFGDFWSYTFSAGARVGSERIQGYVQVGSAGYRSNTGRSKIDEYSIKNLSVALGVSFRLGGASTTSVTQ